MSVGKHQELDVIFSRPEAINTIAEESQTICSVAILDDYFRTVFCGSAIYNPNFPFPLCNKPVFSQVTHLVVERATSIPWSCEALANKFSFFLTQSCTVYICTMRTNIRNFEEWKWRSLRKRRTFFFFFTNAIATLAWAAIHYDGPLGYQNEQIGKHYLAEDLSSSAKFKITLVYGLPSFFFYLHAVGCIIISFTQWGQRVIQESQGKKFCIWTAISLVLAALYLLIPLINKNPTMGSSQRMVRLHRADFIGGSSHRYGWRNPLPCSLLLQVYLLL